MRPAGPGHTGCFCTLASSSGSMPCSVFQGTGGLPGSGEGRAAAATVARAAGSGPQSPGMMTGVLQLCCSSASISLRGPSAGAVSPKVPVKCQLVGPLAARSWTLQVAAGSLWLDHLRVSFHLLHNSTGFHGLILDPNLLERKGSQASVNTMR